MPSEFILSGDTPAALIPYGEPVTLAAGSRVVVTQTLGGNVTVRADVGLCRIAREHTGSLAGYVPKTETGAAGGAVPAEFSEDAVWDALKSCYDPEIPVNIVDLGLVYGVRIESRAVQVMLTLTAPGCPMGGQMVDHVREALSQLPGVEGVQVDLVFDPPWTPDRMSEAARKQLGMPVAS